MKTFRDILNEKSFKNGDVVTWKDASGNQAEGKVIGKEDDKLKIMPLGLDSKTTKAGKDAISVLAKSVKLKN
jgi:hypothetical protein